jgi:hypothetical protein
MDELGEKNPRMQILEMIESGAITAEEGARLLQVIEGDADQEMSQDEAWQPLPDTIAAGEAQAEEESSIPETGEVIDDDPDFSAEEINARIDKLRHWWLIPFWVGIGITIIGGLLMFWAYQASGLGFWFGCAWLPFLLGVAVMAFAVSSRTARWLHLRVRQQPGERPQTIAFSFPLPLRLAAWFVRNFGRFIPQLNRTGLDEMILALGRNTSPEMPFYIEVDEGDNGEKVQIYIG